MTRQYTISFSRWRQGLTKLLNKNQFRTMDKKKVKELIQKAKHLAILRKYENRQTYLNNCICCLEEALKELQKSD